MKTIFDPQTNADLRSRISRLSETDSPEWGQMNAGQMVKHCILSEEMFQGKKPYKRLIIGRVFGRKALKALLKDEAPMKPNQPTHPDFRIRGTVDLESSKGQWLQLMEAYTQNASRRFSGFVHPFFGKMTPEQIGTYVYKHTDHHLRQFGL